MKWNKWLWLQKEGLIIGTAWGIISPFAGLGMATLTEIPLYYKLLILPSYLAGYVPVSGSLAFFTSIIIGAIIGIILDMIYKPNE